MGKSDDPRQEFWCFQVKVDFVVKPATLTWNVLSSKCQISKNFTYFDGEHRKIWIICEYSVTHQGAV